MSPTGNYNNEAEPFQHEHVATNITKLGFLVFVIIILRAHGVMI